MSALAAYVWCRERGESRAMSVVVAVLHKVVPRGLTA